MSDRLRAAWAFWCCVVSFALVWVVRQATYVSIVDARVYRAAGWTVRNGGDLYALHVTPARLPMTYPPFAGMLFVPLTWVGMDTMRAAVTAANLCLALVLVALSLRLAGRRPTAAAVLLVGSLSVWSEPVWANLRFGQVNLLLAVLVLGGLSRRRSSRWAGVGIGIAAGIKLTPVLFIVFLAAAAVTTRGRGTPYLRQAVVATATFAGTVAIAVAVLPHDSLRYWTGVAFAPDRPGFAEKVDNQSLRGIIARLEHTGAPGNLWMFVALVAGAAGLAVAVAALTAGDRLPCATLWAATACGVTAVLISPVSWTHHWVWAVPMTILLVAEAVRRRDRRWAWGAAASVLVFFSYAVWAVPHSADRPELRENAGLMLLAAAYPLAGLAFLAVAACVTAGALRGRPARREPGAASPGELPRRSFDTSGTPDPGGVGRRRLSPDSSVL